MTSSLAARRARAVLVWGATLVALPLAACATGSPPSGRAQVRDVFNFEDLATMVATSDAVLVGTVEALAPGEVEGPPGEEIYHIDARLRVEEILWGSVEDPTVTIESLDIPAFQPDWRSDGTQVLVFLRLAPEPGSEGKFILTNYGQSAYVVDGNDVTTTGGDFGLARSLGEESLDNVRTQVADAAERIEAGLVEPQEPPVEPKPGE